MGQTRMEEGEWKSFKGALAAFSGLAESKQGKLSKKAFKNLLGERIRTGDFAGVLSLAKEMEGPYVWEASGRHARSLLREAVRMRSQRPGDGAGAQQARDLIDWLLAKKVPYWEGSLSGYGRQEGEKDRIEMFCCDLAAAGLGSEYALEKAARAAMEHPQWWKPGELEEASCAHLAGRAERPEDWKAALEYFERAGAKPSKALAKELCSALYYGSGKAGDKSFVALFEAHCGLFDQEDLQEVFRGVLAEDMFEELVLLMQCKLKPSEDWMLEETVWLYGNQELGYGDGHSEAQARFPMELAPLPDREGKPEGRCRDFLSRLDFLSPAAPGREASPHFLARLSPKRLEELEALGYRLDTADSRGNNLLHALACRELSAKSLGDFVRMAKRLPELLNRENAKGLAPGQALLSKAKTGRRGNWTERVQKELAAMERSMLKKSSGRAGQPKRKPAARSGPSRI